MSYLFDEFDDEFGQSIADHEFDAEGTVSQRELDRYIDDLLAQARPDHYDTVDDSWMRPIADKVGEMRVRSEGRDAVIRAAAQADVRRRETAGTRRANRHLRQVVEDAQLALGTDGREWMRMLVDVLHEPLSIDDKRRVRLGAMGADDFEEWARIRDSKRQADYAAVGRSIEGALLIAADMRQRGADTLADVIHFGGVR